MSAKPNQPNGVSKPNKTMPTPPPPPIISKKARREQSCSAKVVSFTETLTNVVQATSTNVAKSPSLTPLNPAITQLYSAITFIKCREVELKVANSELKSLQVKFEEKQAELKSRTDECQDLQKNIKSLTERNKKTEEESASNLKKLHAENMSLKEEVTKVRLENDQKNTSILSLTSNKQNLETELNGMKLVNSKLENTQDKNEKKISKLSTDISRLSRRCKSQKEMLDKSQEKADQLEIEIKLEHTDDLKFLKQIDTLRDSFMTKVHNTQERMKKDFPDQREDFTGNMENCTPPPSTKKQACRKNDMSGDMSSDSESIVVEFPTPNILRAHANTSSLSATEETSYKRRLSVSDSGIFDEMALEKLVDDKSAKKRKTTLH